jgi:hypothetical protein
MQGCLIRNHHNMTYDLILTKGPGRGAVTIKEIPERSPTLSRVDLAETIWNLGPLYDYCVNKPWLPSVELSYDIAIQTLEYLKETN